MAQISRTFVFVVSLNEKTHRTFTFYDYFIFEWYSTLLNQQFYMYARDAITHYLPTKQQTVIKLFWMVLVCFHKKVLFIAIQLSDKKKSITTDIIQSIAFQSKAERSWNVILMNGFCWLISFFLFSFIFCSWMGQEIFIHLFFLTDFLFLAHFLTNYGKTAQLGTIVHQFDV